MLENIIKLTEIKAKELLIYPTEEEKSQYTLQERLNKLAQTTIDLQNQNYQINTQKKEAFKKYSYKLANAIEELSPVFQEKFASKYPDLQIKEELINLCTSDTFRPNDLEDETTNLEKLQWCSALWLKAYITDKEKDKELQEIADIPSNDDTDKFPSMMMHTIKATDEVNFTVDQIIAERNGKTAKGSIIQPTTITENFLTDEPLPETVENEKFQELLYLVDEETIYQLKNDFLENLYKIFDLYLSIKQEERTKIIKQGQLINVQLGVTTADISKTIILLINFQNFYTLDKYYYNDSEISTILGPEYIERANDTIKDIKAMNTAFIAFYMLQTGDNLFWLYPLSRCLLESIIDKIKLPTSLNSYFSNANPEMYFWLTDKKNKAKIQCPNPEAPLNEIKLRFFPKKEKTAMTHYLSLEQYIHSLSGIIDNLAWDEKVKYHIELLKRAGISQDKAEIISCLTQSSVIAGFKLKEKQRKWKRPIKNNNQESVQQSQPNKEPSPQQQKKINDLQKQIEIKSKEIQKLKKQIETNKQAANSKLQKETSYYKEKATRLENKVNDLKAIMKKQSQEKAKEIANEFLMEMIDKQLQNEENKTNINFPIILDRKITVFGGHESWVKQIQLLLPNVTFYPKDKNPDEQLIRNSDAIWIQENAICHSFYHKVADIVKNMGKTKDFNFFNCSSAQACAEKIVYTESQLQERN